jgi:iron complex outermembrane recepter protein
MQRGCGHVRRWLAWAALAALVAGAQAAPPTTESAYFAEIPVALTASRLSQPASDAPSAITVIDRELIRASGAREIADVMRFVPGMYVTNIAYVRGLQAIVSYHGLANELTNRMQVLVDGRAVYNPTLGDVSWSNLPVAIEDIERIEVVRGPSAASHGANAFLGVINIITRHAGQDPGPYASLKLGTNAIDERLVRYGGTTGNLDYRLTTAYREDDTYAAVADHRRIHLFTLRADYRLGTRDTLSLQAGYNGGDRETQAPTVSQPDVIDFPREIGIRNHFQQLQWTRILESGNELALQLYHNYLEVKDVILSRPIPQRGNRQFVIDDGMRAHRYDAELQHTVASTPALRWVWGASWRYDWAAAPSHLRAPVGNHSQRLFGHAEWRAAPRWLLNAGAMLERTDFTGTELSPRLAVNFRLAPRHTLRAGVSRALRNPSLLEEKGDRRFQLGPALVQRFLASGGLRPETIVSRELGYVTESRGGRFAFDLRVFRDRLDGLIGTVRVPFPPSFDGLTRDFRNLDHVRQEGFETQLRARLGETTRLGFAQAHIRTRSSDLHRQLSASAPRNSYSAFVVHDFGARLSGTLMLFRQSEVRAAGFAETQEPFTRVDARLGKEFRLGRSRAGAALVVQNLLNERITDFRHDNVLDRRAYATLEIGF